MKKICSIPHMVQCIIKMEAIEIETKLDSEADVDKTMEEVIISRSLILRVIKSAVTLHK